jgi:hypothetical protein
MRTYGTAVDPGGLVDKERDIFTRIVMEGSDNVKQTLWFGCIALVPGLYQWLTNPMPNKDGEQFPRLNNLEWFNTFVHDVLPPNLELLLNGTTMNGTSPYDTTSHGTTMDVDRFINKMRSEYVKHVGFMVPDG